MDKQTILYTYALSPYGMKVYWALVFKGIDFDLRYVNFRDQHEVSFTGQRIVPVVTVDDEWRFDSGPICCWLDEHFPDSPIAGAGEDEHEAILVADDWVTRNVLGLSWRCILDDESLFSAYRNGRILAQTMRKTYGGIPWGMQFFWYRLLRKVPFIVRDANTVDRSISMAECRAGVLQGLEKRLESTGFVAGTETPTYADISIFAQLVCNTTLGFEGGLLANSSPVVEKFYHDMCSYMDLKHRPKLVADWQPFGMVSS